MYFHLDASLPGNFKICSGSSYAADKVYAVANAGNFPYNPYQTSDYPTGDGAADTTTSWDTNGSHQSEDDVIDLGAPFEAPQDTSDQYRYDAGNNIHGNNQIVEYRYANNTNPSMKGVMKLKLAYNWDNNGGDWDSYWW